MAGWTKTGKPKYAKGNNPGKDRRRRRRNVRKSKFEQREKASLTEVQAVTNQLNANQNYSQYNLSLSSLTRAKDIAKGYQYYRITRVTYVVKPLMDTFVQNPPGGNTNASVPYLYYMIDRVAQFKNGFTLDMLKAMGAKPRRLDDKTITFSFTPSVLTETFDATAGANPAVQYKLSPWLPCKDTSQIGVWNPNSTDHFGVVWRLEQAVGNIIGYSVERRVQVEFKKPAIPPPSGDLEAPIDYEDIDAVV